MYSDSDSLLCMNMYIYIYGRSSSSRNSSGGGGGPATATTTTTTTTTTSATSTGVVCGGLYHRSGDGPETWSVHGHTHTHTMSWYIYTYIYISIFAWCSSTDTVHGETWWWYTMHDISFKNTKQWLMMMHADNASACIFTNAVVHRETQWCTMIYNYANDTVYDSIQEHMIVYNDLEWHTMIFAHTQSFLRMYTSTTTLTTFIWWYVMMYVVV